MIGRSFALLAVGAALLLAACTSGSPASSGVSGCTPMTGAAAVPVSIEDFAFAPAAIQAKVGQVIGFTNQGFESHNATLDSGACGTATLTTGSTAGLVFTAAGTYPFHCTVHTQMTGTITIGG